MYTHRVPRSMANPGGTLVQGYLARKKHPPRRTLQQPYAYGPMVIPGGWVFLMSKVPLYQHASPTAIFGGKPRFRLPGEREREREREK